MPKQSMFGTFKGGQIVNTEIWLGGLQARFKPWEM